MTKSFVLACNFGFAIKCSLIALTLAASSGIFNPSGASIMLSGQVDCDGTPDVALFADRIKTDRQLSCQDRFALDRLMRVAYDGNKRALVWKRMCRQELQMSDSNVLAHIEQLAESCNMPLRIK